MKKPHRRTRLMIIGCATLAAFACWVVMTQPDLTPDAIHESSARELSGIAYVPERGTLIGVSDAEFIVELSLEGTVIRQRDFADRDLEDVALLPGGVEVLVVDERASSLLRIRISDFEILEELPVDPIARAVSANKRYEGLALLGGLPPRVVLVNEKRPAVLVHVDMDSARSPKPIFKEHDLDATSVSALIPSPDGRELVLVSRDDGLRLVTTEGKPLSPWLRLKGDNIEGAALVPGHGLIIACDLDRSRLQVFTPLDSWSALRQRLLRED